VQQERKLLDLMREYRAHPLRTLTKLKAAHTKGVRDLRAGGS